MTETITHYFPDALVIFVPSFIASARGGQTEAVIARNFQGKMIQEIASVHVMRTVANNPGTFSLSLINTDGKFFVPDNADAEIKALHTFSKNSPRELAPEMQGIDFSGANYYNYSSAKQWEEMEVCSITEEGGDPIINSYRVNTRKDINGNIIERWAFDFRGGIIKIDEKGTSPLFKDLNDGDITPAYTTYYSGSPSTSKRFIVRKVTNADFFIKYKTSEQGKERYKFIKGTLAVSPMDRVIIYMSKRFDEDGNMLQRPSSLLERVFTGVVNIAQDGYHNGTETVDIQGEDTSKYLRQSIIYVKPPLMKGDQTVNPFSSNHDIYTSQTDLFKGKKGPDIVKELLLGRSEGATFLRPITEYALSNTDRHTGDQKYDVILGKFVDKVSRKKGQSNRNITDEAVLDLSQMIGALFQKNKIHIIDPFDKKANLAAYRPYELSFAQTPMYQTEFKTRRDIITSIARDMQFVFYTDRYGELWFRPPYFDNSHILAAPFPQYYIIDNPSIVSFGNVEDDSHAYTGIQVSTEPFMGKAPTKDNASLRASYQDDTLVTKYGQRVLMTSNPLIRINANQPGNRATLSLFAKSILQRTNAEIRGGQIQIQLRTELDPGRPVYLPCRNMVLYAETIEHSVVWGQSATTTIHTKYGRKPWEMLPELLEFSKSDMNSPGKVTNVSLSNKNDVTFPQDVPLTDAEQTDPNNKGKTFQIITGPPVSPLSNVNKNP